LHSLPTLSLFYYNVCKTAILKINRLYRRMFALGIFLNLVRVKLVTFCIRWCFIYREASRIHCVGKMNSMQDENKIYEYGEVFFCIIRFFYSYSSPFSSPCSSYLSASCYPSPSIFPQILLPFPLLTSSFQPPC